MVLRQGVSGGLSLPQSNASSTMTPLGTPAALSRWSMTRSAFSSPLLVAQHRLFPVDLAEQRLGVGIDQQLVRVAAMAQRRRVGTVDAQPVQRARLQIGGVAVPGESGVGRQIEAFDLSSRVVAIVEANFDARGDARVDGEVDAAAVEDGAARVGKARPDRSHRVCKLRIRYSGARRMDSDQRMIRISAR